MLLSKDVEDFSPVMQVVACYVQVHGDFLALKRHPDKPYGGLWCFPGGKLDPGESPLEGVMRETREETGIILPSPKEIASYKVRYPKMDFNYTTFHQNLRNLPEVRLNPSEHTYSVWAMPRLFLGSNLDLVPDEVTCFRDFLSRL